MKIHVCCINWKILNYMLIDTFKEHTKPPSFSTLCLPIYQLTPVLLYLVCFNSTFFWNKSGRLLAPDGFREDLNIFILTYHSFLIKVLTVLYHVTLNLLLLTAEEL